nr:hypothetical protein CFP56_38725 [Quercus suber]
MRSHLRTRGACLSADVNGRSAARVFFVFVFVPSPKTCRRRDRWRRWKSPRTKVLAAPAPADLHAAEPELALVTMMYGRPGPACRLDVTGDDDMASRPVLPSLAGCATALTVIAEDPGGRAHGVCWSSHCNCAVGEVLS